MKEQIDVLKAMDAEKRDQKIDSNIKDSTQKLDEMLARSISCIRAELECNKQSSSLTTAVNITKTVSSVEGAK